MGKPHLNSEEIFGKYFEILKTFVWHAVLLDYIKLYTSAQ